MPTKYGDREPQDPAYRPPTTYAPPPAPGDVPPPTPVPGATAPTTPAPTTPAGPAPAGAPPSYVDVTDPVQKAVWDAFTAKGMTPRDQGDFQYWVGRINTTGGGWSNPQNQAFWQSRMAQPKGGVGDYSNTPESGAGAAPSIDQTYLAPFGTPPPALPNAPTPFSLPAFQVPTADSIKNDPSYQLRRDEGAGVLANTASARGLTNSGGTLGDFLKYGQNFASQEYGNIWNRDFGLWNQNALNAASTYATNYQGQTVDPFNRATQQWRDARDTFYANQNNPFDKVMRAGQLGVNAAAA